jgi:tetratricopeptide (TPR) repeat protein
MLLSVMGGAQTVLQLTKAGDKKAEEGDYYAASQYYRDALLKDEENIELNYKYAEACRMFNDLEGAGKGYRATIRLDKSNRYPMAIFWQAQVLRSSCECKCDEALKLLHRFQSKYRKKDYYFNKAQQEIEACGWVRDHSKKNDSVKIEHLGKEVNTPQSEFNAIHVYPDRLQFSALRNISTDKKNEKYLVRIYNQQPNPSLTYTPEGANAELNIGNGNYSPDSKKFVFTQCEQVNKTATRCDIYLTTYTDFKWTPAIKLGEQVNAPAASNTHPAIGYDKAGNEYLFFASNREGGQGNMDIWVSKLNADGTYLPAVNAGEVVNTPGNEVTPFYDINNKKLFFSSDWHYGFGGFDIFETTGEGSSWTEPVNLLQPVNTPQNDLYYSRATDDTRAYITSNRKGSYFIEAETCCNDIYAYNTGKRVDMPKPPVEIKIDTPVVAATIIDTPATSKPDTTTMVVKQEPPITMPDLTPSLADTKPVSPETFIDVKLKQVKQKVGVQLFFHNDEPDARTMNDTTRLDYRQTYEAYYVRRFEYEREYTKNIKGEEKEKSRKEVQDFFSGKVDKGYYDLVAFSAQLLELLQGGNKIEVTVKGFCSPLNINEYNIKLGYRRVASLRNYFYHYRDGVLLNYIAEGKLVIKNESFGEETADKTISDNRLDQRNSVYSPAAAMERRVEILTIELK